MLTRLGYLIGSLGLFIYGHKIYVHGGFFRSVGMPGELRVYHDLEPFKEVAAFAFIFMGFMCLLFAVRRRSNKEKKATPDG